MSISKWLIVATLVGVVVAGSACTQKAADETTNGTAITVDKPNPGSDRTLDATRDGAAAVIDETKEMAEETADKAREIAVGVGSETSEAVSTTGEAITDGWITTKVSAKFVDETLLKGSDINVDTDNHVVTLKGPVTSEAARARAIAVARSTEGVTRVVNQLVVMVR